MLVKPGNNPCLGAFPRLILILFMLIGMFEFQSVHVVYAVGVLYVQPSGLTSGTCTSWASACELQYALSLAASGDEIWAAEGTYYPTSGVDRTASFLLMNGVRLYGGFAGTETLFSQRDYTTNATILSGDLGTLNDVTDNSYHVVKGNSTNNSAVLDGFTIIDGNANGSNTDANGGGIFNDSSSPTLSNLIITENTSSSFGGGVYNNNSNPTLTNVTISNNTSPSSYGGGMFNSGSSPVLTDVSFSSNSAERGAGMYNTVGSNAILTDVTFSSNSASIRGGGMTASGSNLTLTNVTFTGNSAQFGGGIHNIFDSNSNFTNVTFNGNTATVNGGALYITNSNPTLTNITISGNSAGTAGGGLYNDGSNPILINSIVYGNSGGQISNVNSSTPIVSYSIVQGGYAGIGNLNSDPLLEALQDNGGFTQTMALDVMSPAIDVGHDANCPETDQHGVNRPQGSHCDIGAYEFVFPAFDPMTQWTTDYSYNAQQWRVQYHPRLLGDVDGDGDDDIVGFGFDRVLVALSNGANGFAPMSQWTTDFSYNAQQWRTEYHPRLLGDVNGDGKADIVGFGFDRVLVALSNGSGFDPMTQWTTDYSYNAQQWRTEYHPRVLGDVDGDGDADIIGFGFDRVLVALSNGANGFAPMTQWTTDFSYNAQQWRVQYHPRLVGDVNGDGKADIVGFGFDRVLVALSTGTSFAPMTQWTTDYSYNAQQWRTEYHPRLLGDVNGDGKADIVGFGFDRVLVALSNGSGFASMVQATTDYSYNAQQWRVQYHPRLLGDVDGDGQADIVGFGFDRVLVAMAK